MYVSHKIGLASESDEYHIIRNGMHYRNLQDSTIPEEDENESVMAAEENKIGNGVAVPLSEEEVAIKPVPSQKWDFTVCNYLQSKFLGENYILTGMAANESTVFKIRLGEWRVIVCDYLGLKSLLDFSNVDKEADSTDDINTRMLRGHIPCLLADEKDHKRRRVFLAKFFQDATEGMSIKDVAEIIQLEFEKMDRINVNDAETYDVEGAIKKAVVNIAFSVFLGEYMRDSEPDHELVYEWRECCKKTDFLDSLMSLVTLSREKSITNDIFAIIANTIKVKELKVTIGSTDFEFEGMLNEIVYAIAFVAIGDLKDTIMSCLGCYLRLSARHKREIKQEAKEFFEASNDTLEDILPRLKLVHAFYMEVTRLYPLLPRYFRRAKRDFVLKSTSGRFQIEEGDLLCGYPYIARRDPTVFKNPNKISLNRTVDTGKQDFAYGGLYSENSTTDKYGDAFHAMSEKIIKIFILFLTKCSITPSDSHVYTECDFENPKMTIPLKVKHFHYER